MSARSLDWPSDWLSEQLSNSRRQPGAKALTPR